MGVVLENGTPVILAAAPQGEEGAHHGDRADRARARPSCHWAAIRPRARARRWKSRARPCPSFSKPLAPGERVARPDMIAIANSYFSALERNDGKKHVPFDKECNRQENGFRTTNNPKLDRRRRRRYACSAWAAPSSSRPGSWPSSPQFATAASRSSTRSAGLCSPSPSSTIGRRQDRHLGRRPHDSLARAIAVDVRDRGAVQDQERTNPADRSHAHHRALQHEIGVGRRKALGLAVLGSIGIFFGLSFPTRPRT